MKAKVSALSTRREYDCLHPWPKKTNVQCGDRGVVISSQGNYRTAFFEAFPTSPKTFIRGEGSSIEEAETSAWTQYRRIKACANHEFDRRGREDGYGFCIHCNLFKKALPAIRHCSQCRSSQVFSTIAGSHYCKRHYHQLSFEEFSRHTPSMVRFLSSSFLTYKVLMKALSHTNFTWKKKDSLIDDDVVQSHIIHEIISQYETRHGIEEEGWTEESFLQVHEKEICDFALNYWRGRGETV